MIQRFSLIVEYQIKNILNIFYTDTYKYHIKKKENMSMI